MGNCTKLKWNRKRLKMTQKQFAELVGVSVGTIAKLETDETAWGVLRAETVDKISSHFESMASWQPERADKVIQEINDETKVKEEAEVSVPTVVESKPIHNNKLTDNDSKTLILIEFAFEGLKESKTHEDFMANFNMIRRIVNQY